MKNVGVCALLVMTAHNACMPRYSCVRASVPFEAGLLENSLASSRLWVIVQKSIYCLK